MKKYVCPETELIALPGEVILGGPSLHDEVGTGGQLGNRNTFEEDVSAEYPSKSLWDD